jgi:hypothetical protein
MLGCRRGKAFASTRTRARTSSTTSSGSSTTSKIWTAAELEQMSPTERKAIFDASIVTDLDHVPPEFLARVRARVEKIIAETESTDHA